MFKYKFVPCETTKIRVLLFSIDFTIFFVFNFSNDLNIEKITIEKDADI